jgi:ribosomal protein S6E (S10)
MAEKLHPNADQQEDRAEQMSNLARLIDQQLGKKPNGLTLTLKGEEIHLHDGDDKGGVIIAANADNTFTIQNGPSHLSADDVLQHLKQAKS